MAMVIVGLMKDPQEARGAVNALREAGFELEQLDSEGNLAECLAEMGVPEGEVGVYAEGVRRGGTIVGVAAQDEVEAEDAAHIMAEHGAVDLGACAQSWDPEAVELMFGEQPLAHGAMYRDARARRRYDGPNRRMRDQPYAGVDRRL